MMKEGFVSILRLTLEDVKYHKSTNSLSNNIPKRGNCKLILKTIS